MNTSRLLGGALGLAILATVAAGHTNDISPAAVSHGFAIALGISAAVCASGAVISLIALPTARGEAGDRVVAGSAGA